MKQCPFVILAEACYEGGIHLPWGRREVNIECGGVECAWYDEKRKQCAILTIAVALSNINGGLAK